MATTKTCYIILSCMLTLALTSQAAAQQTTGPRAYNFDGLTDKDKEVYASDFYNQLPRGSISLLFPHGRKPQVGRTAEQWITAGKPVRAITFVGMPTTSLDSWGFGKELANLNADHARTQARKSPGIKKALATVTAQNPGLSSAAAKLDLNDQGLLRALRQQARRQPGLGKMIDRLQHELTAPVVVVKNGWNDAGIPAGAPFYSMLKRPQNERGQASLDTVAAKVTSLLVKRFTHAAKQPAPIALVGHCAGGYHAAEVALRIKGHDRGLLKNFVGLSLSAAVKFPAELRHRNVVSFSDRFGQINSSTKALLRSKTTRGSHMLSRKWAHLFDGQQAPTIEPLASLFNQNLFKAPRVSRGRYGDALSRQLSLRRHATTFRAQAAEANKMSGELDTLTASSDRTMPAYRIMKAKLTADASLFDAKALIVTAAARRQKAKRYELRAERLEGRKPALAQALRHRAAQTRATARGEITRAVAQRRAAGSALRSTISAIPRSALSDMTEYQQRSVNSWSKQAAKWMTNPVGAWADAVQGKLSGWQADMDGARLYTDIGFRMQRQLLDRTFSAQRKMIDVFFGGSRSRSRTGARSSSRPRSR